MVWVPFIALIVSIISLTLTIYKYWIDHKENKLNITVDLKNHYVADYRNVFELNVINKTKNPVSITKILICDNVENMKIESLQSKVLLTKTKNIRNESSKLPVNLSSLSSEKIFIVFDLQRPLHSYDFEIHTNKGIHTTNYKGKLVKVRRLLDLAGLSINK
ncbi:MULTISPECIES: hypothetical protein [unclassified Staphylococcus]|uniref:hypothetical protein n=1 Tax=unclassified Staphylococcus TaxID=91994 RepID=UPI0021D236B6|nr:MULTISPECIES: hypothetical protein [unclassified Staphylococcus]UXR72335.1 hypothetical protein MUA88_03925 [Staphylococcus sp. IVB6240]UXR75626.1 hypothetical protein MUA74_08120 [Staphylococcus sp. IVB6233]UXR79826.1 hypothetical protein MUA65_07725 [Staphylococcus sp. IVB6218]